jgi:vancomycin permeability regulator SanA
MAIAIAESQTDLDDLSKRKIVSMLSSSIADASAKNEMFNELDYLSQLIVIMVLDSAADTCMRTNGKYYIKNITAAVDAYESSNDF